MMGLREVAYQAGMDEREPEQKKAMGRTAETFEKLFPGTEYSVSYNVDKNRAEIVSDGLLFKPYDTHYLYLVLQCPDCGQEVFQLVTDNLTHLGTSLVAWERNRCGHKCPVKSVGERIADALEGICAELSLLTDSEGVQKVWIKD